MRITKICGVVNGFMKRKGEERCMVSGEGFFIWLCNDTPL